MDCIFCRIVAGKVPSQVIYQDEEIFAFRDINPMAPTHVLVIPKKHIDSLADVADEETPLIGRMVKIANRIAREEDVAESGYRLIISSGKEGGQVVPHLHMHLLGGRNLSSKLC